MFFTVIYCNYENKGKIINMKHATFGAGCFWCIEAIFDHLDGIIDIQVGYSGGTTKNPNYEQVCKGNTGHAEVIQVAFDPLLISYNKLLKTFWESHDPTSLNRQGADYGTQYRSVIFYHDKEQNKIASEAKDLLDNTGIYTNPIVTEIKPLDIFYKAEEYHQDYYNKNKNAPYCKMVIQPKINLLFK